MRSAATCRPLLAAGGVVGPLAFIAAWAALGAGADGYSSASDPISALAATDAPTRVPMTAGLVALGCGLVLYGAALVRRRPGAAWVAAVVTGVCALGVAATPLEPNRGDRAHGAFAAAGYAALAATPLSSARALRRGGGRGRAAWAVAAGTVTGACLAATAGDGAVGALQRIGLTVGHLWVVVDAWHLLRPPGRPPAGPGTGAAP